MPRGGSENQAALTCLYQVSPAVGENGATVVLGEQPVRALALVLAILHRTQPEAGGHCSGHACVGSNPSVLFAAEQERTLAADVVCEGRRMELPATHLQEDGVACNMEYLKIEKT